MPSVTMTFLSRRPEMIQEFTPKNGWLAHYRKQAAIRKIKSLLMAIGAFAVYALAVTITETI